MTAPPVPRKAPPPDGRRTPEAVRRMVELCEQVAKSAGDETMRANLYGAATALRWSLGEDVSPV